MRAFLIKYLFGRYWWRFPGQQRYNKTDRGSFWNFNGFLLIGITWMIFGRPDWILLLSIPWGAQVLYFGFTLGGLGYFSRYPVRWEELDEEQKWFYGDAATSGDLSKALPFSSEQFLEWSEIRQRMRKKYRLI